MASTTNNGWATPDDTSLVKDGASAIRTLGSAIDTSVGTGLLAWTAYTPTFTNLTLGNGTIDFKYALLGKNVFVRGVLTWGSTTSATASGLNISAPVTALSGAATGAPLIGHARYSDIGTANYTGNVLLASTSQFALIAINTASTYASFAAVNNTAPMTWVSTDQLTILATYQAA
jgi:hypothetical protein